MPTLTRWFIKTAFLYFVLALMVGILLAIRTVAGLFPVYLHLLVFGWLTQLIFGMVFWMFPKYSSERPRGSWSLGWLTYMALNAGLLLRAVAEPFNAQEPGRIWGWLLVSSAGLQWLAGVLFVINSWGRVKAK